MKNEDLRKTPRGKSYHMWYTFLLLTEILYMVDTVRNDGLMKKPEESLPKAERQMSKKVREGSFLQVVGKILETLQEKLVSIRGSSLPSYVRTICKEDAVAARKQNNCL